MYQIITVIVLTLIFLPYFLGAGPKTCKRSKIVADIQDNFQKLKDTTSYLSKIVYFFFYSVLKQVEV